MTCMSAQKLGLLLAPLAGMQPQAQPGLSASQCSNNKSALNENDSETGVADTVQAHSATLSTFFVESRFGKVFVPVDQCCF